MRRREGLQGVMWPKARAKACGSMLSPERRKGVGGRRPQLEQGSEDPGKPSDWPRVRISWVPRAGPPSSCQPSSCLSFPIYKPRWWVGEENPFWQTGHLTDLS